MEAVKYVTDWVKWLIPVIAAGAAFRVTYCWLKLTYSHEDTAQTKKSMRNTLIASAIMVTITSFIEVLKRILS